LTCISLSTHGSFSRVESVLKQYARQEDPLEAHGNFWGRWRTILATFGVLVALFRVQMWQFSRGAPPQLLPNCTEPTMTPYRCLPSTIVFDATPCTVLVALRQETRRSIASKQAPMFLQASFDDQ
jgi:hypothetical protein